MLLSNAEEKHTARILPPLLALLAVLLVQGTLVLPVVVDDEHVCLQTTKQFLRLTAKSHGMFRHLVPLSPGCSAELHTVFSCRFNDTIGNGSPSFDQITTPSAAPKSVDAARAPPQQLSLVFSPFARQA